MQASEIPYVELHKIVRHPQGPICQLPRNARAGDQIILTLARLPRYSCPFISFRQLSRSRTSALEQLGEHQGGAGG